MAKETRKQSSLGILGCIIIALGLALGYIMSNIVIVGACVSGGVFILLIAAIVDRLDTIIDLLRQISENNQGDKTAEEK